MSLGEGGHSQLGAGFKVTAHECRPPSYDRAATDFDEPARTSHISKMVLSIIKFGGRGELARPILFSAGC